MTSTDKARGDDFERVIRGMVDNLLELHGLPRKRWKAVDIRGFKVMGRKIGEILATCKAGRKHIPIGSGYVPQDADETEEGN